MIENDFYQYFNLEQTIEEQVATFEEIFQVEELAMFVLSITEFYESSKELEETTDLVDEEAVEDLVEAEEAEEIKTEEKEENTVVNENNVSKKSWITAQITSFDSVISSKQVEYMAKIIRSNVPLTSLPVGTKGSVDVSNSCSYINKTYKIIEEAVTEKGTFAKFYLNGGYAWIDKNAIEPEAMSSTKNTHYPATITRGTDTLNSLPWGVSGFETYSKTDIYLGKEVYVLKETTTPRAKWAYVRLFDGTDLGWMDINGISERGEEPILSSENVNYQAKITGVHSLDSAPWGTKGYQTVDSSSNYLGKTYYVLEEATTYRATWAKINLNGKHLWIDLKGLEPETISNQRTITYDAVINRGTDTINTLPWGEYGIGNRPLLRNFRPSNADGKTTKCEKNRPDA